MSENILAVIDVFDKTVYDEPEKEDVSDLPMNVLEKKLKKIDEQNAYFRAENRLLHNYLTWYKKKTTEKLESGEVKQILLLPIGKKREIAEASFKVLLAYSHKYGVNATQYADECMDTMETDDETSVYLELELLTLEKFMQKIDQNNPKKFFAEEFAEFFRDRIRYREALNERVSFDLSRWIGYFLVEQKRQKTVRLRFNIDSIEKSIRKVRQIVDTVTEIDFEQLQIDIQKQLKELTHKNKMLVFYKRQQSDANMKLNAKKPDLFKELTTLTTTRNELNGKIQQLNHSIEIGQKMQDEITAYGKMNNPLREMITSYRVPSITDYVHLKSKQIHLHRQQLAWERKVQIGERELHLRRIEAVHYPEKVVHPWKYLQNPSRILFYEHYRKTQKKMMI